MKPTDIKTFTVYGDPAPKGSWRSFRNPRSGKRVMVPDNADAQANWKKNVVLAARQADVKPLSGPVALTIQFMLPRPQGDFTKGGSVKDSANVFPVKKPDIDKLLRSVQDILGGIAYRDDNQVCQVNMTKIYNGVKLSVCQTTISVSPME